HWERGWIVNSQFELLFWVPPWNRVGLYSPENLLVIGQQPTQLDFTNFVHGRDWMKCI
ncbi:hypothetical protein JAAARDRAFT_101194, partial [Jaapia argillacea MUCL 33604]